MVDVITNRTEDTDHLRYCQRFSCRKDYGRVRLSNALVLPRCCSSIRLFTAQVRYPRVECAIVMRIENRFWCKIRQSIFRDH